ncbi:MAG TPA: outer membrane beta-barrel protein [Bacteroidia bacterium]|jgi:hypothetical protein
MVSSFISKASIGSLMLCLFFINGFSQVYSNKESSTFSMTVGLTSSNLINDSVKYRSGILCNGGFIYSVVLSEKLNIGVEALYTGKAFKNESPIIKYRYFYIDVPLYLQYKLSENIRFNLGAQYSSFTNSKIVVIDQSSNSGVNIKPSSSIKNTDYGFLAGAEIDLSDNLALTARYTISASTFFEKDAINFGVFQLSFNYSMFRTHKQFFHRQKE